MQFQGAAVKIQGVKVGIVAVKEWVLENHDEGQRYVDLFTPVFKGNPVILMAVNAEGKPRYGSLKRHQSIARLLQNLDPNKIPWRKFVLTKQPH
ncbi:hypothetical protein [Brevibacillus migulae]|uniref:hypothetical protein n=1 Tax=Brevibacillus migulae TaxID=1644114 RepID=UPI00106EF3B8|nr:hypothetical protein [Brevibacillus migulae]